ncbi:MAG TPA: L-seryl-tRNA(Sec) selenium transferase [Roseiflexaceae bacterium]|nr:L-seryl-tRNA(Sec) selenium transferase [Roseiflexaceae bacterium]
MVSPFRHLPSVDALVQQILRDSDGDAPPRELLVEAARAALEQARRAIGGGGPAPQVEQLHEAVLAQARAALRPSLRPVINATGVIIQTNLGRAPLSDAALAAMRTVGAGYSNLEYDLEAGARGSRAVHVAEVLRRLTGAEAALAVNNNAAAVYLALLALAAGREVVISRGQAVEIGGGFRIPDVLRQSGATLVEVGTTNRTYARDYEAAVGERTALLMRIHTSNFRLTGFVHETALADMVAVARARGVAVLDDLGSGTLLPTAPYGLAPEPTVQESVAAGADLVSFSGDKLLGGPQAGLIVGRAALVARLKQHPLARALRVDKTTLAALEATLLAYLHGRATEEIPVWRMISAPAERLRARAERLTAQIGAQHAALLACTSAIGGGSLPGETLPSYGVALRAGPPDPLAALLRAGDPPVVGRIVDGRLLLDLRTVLEEQEDMLLACVRRVLGTEG